MLAQENKPTSIITLFTTRGLVKIEACPSCGSKKFNVIDHNNWFHCWGCRLVCPVKNIQEAVSNS